jgi:Holliday junction resolvase
MNKETGIMRQIEQYLRDNRIWFIRVNADATTVGVPDIIACYKGIMVGLEVKTPSGKPTELQKRVIQAIKESGGWGGFPKSLEEAVELLNQSTSCFESTSAKH